MKEFDARAVAINGNEIILDQTLFFPEGGGQINDTGEINEIRVIAVQKRNGKIVNKNGIEIVVEADVVHTLEREPNFKVGDAVHGRIDWKRRYRIMKLHSASHIMEHFLFKVFGKMQRLGSRVDDKKDRSDYITEEKFDKTILKHIEDLCNEFISRNLFIEVSSDPSEPDFRHWRSGEIEIDCCALSPEACGEIGKIRLKRESIGAGKDRIETYLLYTE